MMQVQTIQPPKTVRVIPSTVQATEMIRREHRQLRVAAYCRVSTKQEEQLNSYDVQKMFYTDKINAEPKVDAGGHLRGQGHYRHQYPQAG
ncbi:hypothetical protein [Ruthenibacterium lactatiformans]|uniref:hypothetical protein n=1 Tax=Ruthenibacterium lactatiformans TaxID=1550024 RepID=UPI00308080B0